MASKADDAWIDAHAEEAFLIDAGLLEPDQPTRAAHLRARRRYEDAGREFTADERRALRRLLGATDGD